MRPAIDIDAVALLTSTHRVPISLPPVRLISDRSTLSQTTSRSKYRISKNPRRSGGIDVELDICHIIPGLLIAVVARQSIHGLLQCLDVLLGSHAVIIVSSIFVVHSVHAIGGPCPNRSIDTILPDDGAANSILYQDSPPAKIGANTCVKKTTAGPCPS